MGGGTFGRCKGTTEVSAGGACLLLLTLAVERGPLPHFIFAGIKFPLGAVSWPYACPGEEQRVPPAPSQWEESQGWRHAGEPSSQPGRGLDGSMAFPARLGPLPALPAFISWSPLREHNLSLPNAVQNPQVTTAAACGFFLYL